ncbi:MAG TPA: hypothetical protein VKE74_00895 [Gemmataceae bacterium]|nr:hypothetical protein [Gemmataceae bacterium]
MRTRHLTAFFILYAAGSLGCSGGNQPAFPELHSVKGVVKKDGQPVSGGSVRFVPDPDKGEFLVNSEVGPDGTFSLSTVRTTDRSGERRSGAPAGKYKVTYTPPLGDQSAGPQANPIDLPNPITVSAGDNDIPIDLPKK